MEQTQVHPNIQRTDAQRHRRTHLLHEYKVGLILQNVYQLLWKKQRKMCCDQTRFSKQEPETSSCWFKCSMRCQKRKRLLTHQSSLTLFSNQRPFAAEVFLPFPPGGFGPRTHSPRDRNQCSQRCNPQLGVHCRAAETSRTSHYLL